MVYVQARKRPKKWDVYSNRGFWDTNGLPRQKTKSRDNQGGNLLSSRLCSSGGAQSENKSKRKDWQILGPGKGNYNVVEHKDNSDINCNSHAWNGSQRLKKVTGRIGYKKKKLW